MQTHNLKPKISNRRGQRVGRGGKRGKTSGRGTKGQKARAGHKIRPAIRDMIKKLPKKRGYQFKSFKTKHVVVTTDILEGRFRSGDVVSPQVLLEKGLIRRIKGRTPMVKILSGKGKLQKRFVFKDVSLSFGLRKGKEGGA